MFFGCELAAVDLAAGLRVDGCAGCGPWTGFVWMRAGGGLGCPRYVDLPADVWARGIVLFRVIALVLAVFRRSSSSVRACRDFSVSELVAARVIPTLAAACFGDQEWSAVRLPVLWSVITVLLCCLARVRGRVPAATAWSRSRSSSRCVAEVVLCCGQDP
eukprot:TRINITY_DN555_c0_g1_i1.p1 TRINITY_DN555_c0_g1~~TRINITY_DN555_c0_g1_i1.p1  ORF type:complete len:160 (-),score=13.44 TRINITY_DN555_c0_g1_i1:100-579(-)